jgi:hypothetical protein
MKLYNDETTARFTIALVELLRGELNPEYANDRGSLAFIPGPLLDEEQYIRCAEVATDSKMDMVYLEFQPGRERFGPTSVAIFAERAGVVYSWRDCVLWAPKDGGPLLAMPKGLNMCFSHDGRALISHLSRPTRTLRNGIARARNRLLKAARAVTAEQIAGAKLDLKRAA